MEVEGDFSTVYPQLGGVHEACQRENVVLPKDKYAASEVISAALKATDGEDEGALELLKARFGRTATKRENAAVDAVSGSKKRAKVDTSTDLKDDDDDENDNASDASNGNEDNGNGGSGDNNDNEEEEEDLVDVEEDEVEEVPADEQEVGEKEEEPREEIAMPPHKRVRLAEEVREHPAAHASNQRIVDAFATYGEQQLDRGHTGKGVTHLRAALAIRNFPDAITSGTDARAVSMVGDKMATQVEQVLAKGTLGDETPWMNVSSADVGAHTPPDLVMEVRRGNAVRPENQPLVDKLAAFGEHELYYGSGGKGTAHLRAARELQLTTEVITSGFQARDRVHLIGDVIATKIDEILEEIRVEQEGAVAASDSSTGSKVAPIVQSLRDVPATRPENQPIVNALLDYGDSHLHSGHRGKGVAHLRATRAIRDSKTVVLNGKQASEAIALVGERVGTKIDQILAKGHADSDMEVEAAESEEGSEFGERERDAAPPPLVREVRRKPAEVAANQSLVDALAAHGEAQLNKRHTGRGTAFLRAARQLRDAKMAVESGVEAQSLGRIGDKVAAYLDDTIAKQKVFGATVAAMDTAEEVVDEAAEIIKTANEEGY